MNTTIVVYGSMTGTCEAIAEKIAKKLGCETLNVQDLTTDVVDNHQNLILGTVRVLTIWCSLLAVPT